MTTLQTVELGVLGPLQVRQYGLPVAIPGAKPRAILTMLGLHGGSVVSADTLVELLWGDDPPRTAAKALQTHISALRRALGDGFVLTVGTGWTLSTTEVDATRYKLAARTGRDAVAAGDTSQAVARFDEALTLWRGTPELPDGSRGVSEKTRWIESHAALVEDRADALLATGRAAEIIGELEAAIADAPLRERRWGQLMLALYRAGRQGEALGAYQRARSLLADELGVDPGPDLRRLEAAIVAQDTALEIPVSQQLSSVMRAVTFLLTDIEGSTAAWEADADAMAVALARHDEIVEQVVTSRGGRLVKTRGEGDATFSVFDRPSAAAAAAIELQEAIRHEPWALAEPLRIRVALHTGEVELRDGDYFGRAVNRAARLRSLAAGGQILCSGATAELVIDTLADDVVLADLGMRQLKNLARPEHVFELRLETADDSGTPTTDEPMERPSLPAVLAGPGPFVGRGRELERLLSAYQLTLDGGTGAVLIAGEPGVGKTRLAGEWSRQAFEQGAVVLYGRCDEDLGAPYQPFAEALRSLVPCLGSNRVRGLRGVEALLPLVPGLIDALPDLAAPPRADPDTERYALFDAVVALLGVASTSAPVVLILDDLHWAAKSTLLLLRHLLRFGEHARVQILGTYRSTDLDRSHPLAAMLADLHRDGSSHRLQLSGLDEDDVTAYVAEAGYDDEELARALASVTGGNPFFLIEALRHVDESGGRWDPSTLPQGVREAVSRRLSRLPAETNKALAAAAVVGSRFALALVESVVGEDLVDAFDEASKAGIVIEEPGGRYRFNHAIVRQSLLAELASVRRMRLHQRIAATLETEPGADDELLAELAYHYFECAWAGNAAKAVEYCRRAADQATAHLAFEGAADLYDKALHALEEIDDELPDRDDQQAELLVARCEALLAAGDVVSAKGAVSQLQDAARDSARLAAWGACFDGQLSMLTDPERLDEIEVAVGAAAVKLAGLDDAAGEAKAHTVRAGCLARLGRIGDCETALDQALTAARRAGEHRRVNAVLANAPLAALWGPNPVPRAGGRCLDVVRLLRITTGSPVVEATSTRCQGVLDAFRGRAAAGRQLIDSARRSLTELGMRHALLEVDQFAGIIELVADDPASAEPHLRRAYSGFGRMGLEADTAETAALLARACLALDRDAEANELCTESERLAGHALKPSIAWRTVRAQLLARSGAHDEARRVAEEAVAIAERTDALVDHGDACLALATVLRSADDGAGTQAAAERAVALYEVKGAAALAEKARILLVAEPPAPAAPSEAPVVDVDTACARAIARLGAAVGRDAWDDAEQLFATEVSLESHRKVVGFPPTIMSSSEWVTEARHLRETGAVRHRNVVLAVRGERLALTRSELGTEDESPGAPQVELLRLFGLDEEGRIALQVAFDIEDVDAAIAELDAAHARLEKGVPRPPLENASSRADHRLNELCADKRWDEFGSVITDDIRIEDRRRGFRSEHHGRASLLAEAQTIGDLGTESVTSDVLAIRGECLALVRVLFLGRDKGPDAFRTEFLRVVEVDADERILAYVVFDPDDIEAASEELDGRYLAGEAAPHAHTWSVIAKAYAAFNRRELPATTPEWGNVDHRRGAAFAPGDMIAYIQAAWGDSPDTKIYIAAVHRLSNLGGVVTHVAHGISQEGFDAEWRDIHILTVEGETLSRSELFDEADIDAALATFDGLSQPTPQLKNAASQVWERLNAYFSSGDWAAMSQAVAQNMIDDDRRRTVNGGIRRGRDIQVANGQAVAETGADKMTSTVIAIRGVRLALCRSSFFGRDQQPGAFRIEFLSVVEIDVDEQVVAHVGFDLDDFDAAIAELDARYLAGEAAAHARTWSVIAASYASVSRGGLPPTTPDWVTIDHRRAAAFAPGELIAYIRAGRELDQGIGPYVEVVHRLTNRGAVVTYAAHARSSEGFDAEWREITMSTVDGDLIDRCEIFDESDIDAALARFEQLTQPGRRLENAASRVDNRLFALFVDRRWEEMGALYAHDILLDDRRQGLRRTSSDRATQVNNVRAIAALGVTNITQTPLALRGDRLCLSHVRYDIGDSRPAAFDVEMLAITEVDTAGVMVARVVLDLGDLEAAFEELDARYLAGEAAPFAQVWRMVMDGRAAMNRHEPLPTTWGQVAYVDHRRVPFAPEEFGRAVTELWTLVPDARYEATAVYALDAHGTVINFVIEGTDAHGSELQWPRTLLIFFGDGETRMDVFEVDDVDAALARFDELSRPAPQLENAASRAYQRFEAYFASRDWDALRGIAAKDFSSDDRRRTVNAGLRHGVDDEIEDLRASADAGFANMNAAIIATRGDRLALALARASASRIDDQSETFHGDALNVIEVDADERFVAVVVIDPDDLDAAFGELDARYLAGEAAAYSHTWSVMAQAFAATNRREMPEFMPDFVNIDHRRARAFAPGDLTAYIRATWDLAPDVIAYAEAVHRLSNLGAVFTQAVSGTSQDGFHAEWREIVIATVDRSLINRIELFEEADVDVALARFDELSRAEPRLENAACRAGQQLGTYFTARDWHAVRQTLADNFSIDDRRRIVNAGIRHGRDAEIEDLRAAADVGFTNLTPVVIATRGGRLALSRARYSDRDQIREAIQNDVLHIVEIDADERIAAVVVFDVDDIDAAFAELDARYAAGEAADHALSWSVIAEGFAALNRHEVPATTPDFVDIDHRRVANIDTGGMKALLRTALDLTPVLSSYVEAVHRLSNLGAVVTQVAHGTSQDDADWRVVEVLTVEGDLINRCEVFDEADLDAAVARLDELSRPARRLENAASRLTERFVACFASRDWTAMAELLAEDMSNDDRRRVVGAGLLHGRDTDIASMRAVADVGTTNLSSTVIATRGERLVLSRLRFSGRDQRPEAFYTEALGIAEINADNRITARVAFDLDDIDTAFEELDARYLASEAAAHAHTWSVIAQGLAAFNRRELPGFTPDSVNIDHRRARWFAPGDLTAYIGATWDLAPDVSAYAEAVHRLSNLGAVFAHAVRGTSQDGFDAEWREICLATVEGELINRIEMFDEEDIDAALAKFDELSRPTRQLENLASQVNNRFDACFAARDWGAMAALLTDDTSTDDRRRVVNAGVRHGRDVEIASMRSVAEIGVTNATSVVIATREQRLALLRTRFSGRDQSPEAFHTEIVDIVEIDTDNRITARVAFDPDDIDAAFEELDARYLAGEAAAHAHTWSLITACYAALNRRELPPTTADFIDVDHRRVTALAPGDLIDFVRAAWNQIPDISFCVEAVHRLSSRGAVVTQAIRGSSREGFEAEWRGIHLMTVEGDQFNRSEFFDETDLEAALARFEELNRPS